MKRAVSYHRVDRLVLELVASVLRLCLTESKFKGSSCSSSSIVSKCYICVAHVYLYISIYMPLKLERGDASEGQVRSFFCFWQVR